VSARPCHTLAVRTVTSPPAGAPVPGPRTARRATGTPAAIPAAASTAANGRVRRRAARIAAPATADAATCGRHACTTTPRVAGPPRASARAVYTLSASGRRKLRGTNGRTNAVTSGTRAISAGSSLGRWPGSRIGGRLVNERGRSPVPARTDPPTSDGASRRDAGCDRRPDRDQRARFSSRPRPGCGVGDQGGIALRRQPGARGRRCGPRRACSRRDDAGMTGRTRPRRRGAWRAFRGTHAHPPPGRVRRTGLRCRTGRVV
jgi:hypothetical protein